MPLEPYEVKPADEGWDVRLEGEGRVRRCMKKREALQHANTRAIRENRPGVMVYRGDGKFQRFETNLDFWRDQEYQSASPQTAD